jgi:flagellar basal-body rod protein FlgC
VIDGTNAALSALNAFSKSLAVVSNNVANSNTDGYKKRRAVLEEGENGGVDVYLQQIDSPESLIPHEQTASVQTEETSNVDLAEETLYMITAQRGYEANLKSLTAQVELRGTVLEILG